MNKTAVITGASGGIGLELAKLCSKNGYNLVLIARSEQKLFEIKKEFELKYENVVKCISKDLSKCGASTEVYNEVISKYGVPDIVINNAGFGDYGNFTETKWETELNMINLNIVALTEFSKLFATSMKQKGYGRILNVASIAGFIPIPLMAVYSSTKAYVLQFSVAINSELKGTGVSVTALCPGPTATGFETAASMGDSGMFKKMPVASAESVAKIGYKAMMKQKAVSIPGINKMTALNARFFPKAWIADAIRKFIA